MYEEILLMETAGDGGGENEVERVQWRIIYWSCIVGIVWGSVAFCLDLLKTRRYTSSSHT